MAYRVIGDPGREEFAIHAHDDRRCHQLAERDE
jgi:hypothetical protein